MPAPHIDAALPGRMDASYRLILSLCDRLEAVADGLPSADRQECLVLARSLGPHLARARDFEEAQIHPLLRAWPALSLEIEPTLERLRLEHQMDLFYAEEVQEMLHGLGCGRPALSADAAGFMLRGFFESLRRHVAFEQSLLVPLAGEASRRRAG